MQGEKLITVCSQFKTLLLDGLIINTAIRHFTYPAVPEKHQHSVTNILPPSIY